MILIGLGANLPSLRHGPPRATLEGALLALADAGVGVIARSRWYESAPVPPSDQPWFVNGVARIETARDPADLLDLLLAIERGLGRERRTANAPRAPRVIDLDLLAYGEVISDGAEGPVLPHPRLHERAFVLLPLGEIAPDWRHPALGRSVGELIEALGGDQEIRPL
ncbi:MAG: 2-amino-4-hydroxy-6-hydroxymethyldihydropteridine diphosphokinase [Proteobacteria bacterium]|nr:2-amino-4-hydroxy-6-hydroxymethyldihydropteridine diphosphokinase [Pseudomonadota bacterium]MCH8091625.1 2-amino-4-hydroxy-6-hydroxymethyldihydropteridine diphosphokinase [Pseudomonadota bacterium]MCH8095993.1 2-amino-4-hydroxy-6-hydroxymethyldihydropteridine diphosphokinase [Pseudomonadota bacterium]